MDSVPSLCWPSRLEDAITALKNIFLQQRLSANSLFLCQVYNMLILHLTVNYRLLYHNVQVLCSLTTLLIMIEKTLVMPFSFDCGVIDPVTTSRQAIVSGLWKL